MLRFGLSICLILSSSAAVFAQPVLDPGRALGPAPVSSGPAGASANLQGPAAPGGVGVAEEDYALSSGDQVRITVFNEPSLSGEYGVSAAGTVALPLVGEVRALGLSPRGLQNAITAAYSDGYLRNPRVGVEVNRYRPFYILGEVNKPGEYTYSSGLTVLKAVATANGFTYRADKKHVYLQRAGATREERLDLDGLVQVGPGDTIRIKERYF